MTCVGVVFSHSALLSVAGLRLQSWQQPEVFGGPQGVPLVNNSISMSQYCDWKLHLVTRDGQLGSVSPIIWQFPLHLLLHMYALQDTSTVLGFHMTPQMTINLSCLSPYFLPCPLLSSWSSCSLLFQPHHPSITIVFPFLMRSLCATAPPPNPLLYPTLCAPMECSLAITDLTANVHTQVKTCHIVLSKSELAHSV